MSRNLIASAFALACVATVSASSYTLDASDQYSGSKFFDGFVFKSEPDPTEGYVQYSTQADAASTKYGSKLIDTVNGASYMGVDHTNTYTEDQQGRPSVRIESKRFYNHGLFILDLAHMPASICGTWPAFWTYSRVNYPAQGEIDILENIHEKTASLNVLHTSPGFSVAGNNISKQQTNNQTTYSCDDNATSSPYGTQALKQGCTGTNSDPNSFGSTLNAAGGGVFAMEWTSDVIRVWNFDPKKVPSDVTAGKPEPSGWGLPSFTTAQGTGKIDDHFKDHRIVFDTSFCGLYAGQKGFWEETSCYKKDPVKFATCKSYVGANPEAYKDSYWLIKSLKVYQETGEAPSVPASSLSEASSRIPASSNVPASPNVSASIILSPSLASSTTGSSANVEPGATSISSSR
ncbi:glycoside hydrolase family 16 protein [Amylocarpus encephaloides]|uniref:Glycoside hydrolase family 16 protein n=1 Tax=Amylocarpus encephaloides TaxID=45428 RepID=A0A9P8C503_9HELO|nr:glycoside hydrolase family 16 protein [Amylocarpus encephaloides]